MNKQIDKLLLKSKNVAIIGHINPDGDCFGSMCAVHDYIESKFKCNIHCFADCEKVGNDFVDFVDNLTFNPTIKDAYDLCICVDTADENRLGRYTEVFSRSLQTICIDHHNGNTNFANINIVEARPSCCEILYYLFKNIKFIPSKTTLSKLYAGIITDTNNLTTNSVSQDTYLAVADIVQSGVNTYKIRQFFFGGNSLPEFNLLSLAMSTAKLYNNNTIMIMQLSKNDLKKCNADVEDLNGIINQAFCLKSAICAVLITQRYEKFHISFRAKGDIDVSKIAKLYGGGGHKPASACTVEKVTKQMLNDIIENLSNQINSIPKTTKNIFD